MTGRMSRLESRPTSPSSPSSTSFPLETVVEEDFEEDLEEDVAKSRQRQKRYGRLVESPLEQSFHTEDLRQQPQSSLTHTSPAASRGTSSNNSTESLFQDLRRRAASPRSEDLGRKVPYEGEDPRDFFNRTNTVGPTSPLYEPESLKPGRKPLLKYTSRIMAFRGKGKSDSGEQAVDDYSDLPSTSKSVQQQGARPKTPEHSPRKSTENLGLGPEAQSAQGRKSASKAKASRKPRPKSPPVSGNRDNTALSAIIEKHGASSSAKKGKAVQRDHDFEEEDS